MKCYIGNEIETLKRTAMSKEDKKREKYEMKRRLEKFCFVFIKIISIFFSWLLVNSGKVVCVAFTSNYELSLPPETWTDLSA